MNVLGVIQVWHFRHSPTSQTSKRESIVEIFNIRITPSGVERDYVTVRLLYIHTIYEVVHNINRKEINT